MQRLALTSLIALTALGCGSSSSSSGVAGATAAVASATPSPTTSTVMPTPMTSDADAPELLILTPERGAFLTTPSVTVTGAAVDPSGVDYVLVNNELATLDPTGAFTHTLAVAEGMNFIHVVAADLQGNVAQSALPVTAGTFAAANDLIRDAVVLRLNQGSFDKAEDLAAQQLGGVSLGNLILAQNPLFVDDSGATRLEVNATAASFGTPDLQLTPTNAGLVVHATIPSVDLTARVTGRVTFIPFSLTTRVTASRARLDATAVASIDAQGKVQIDLTQVDVNLDDFRFDIRNVPGFLENLARNRVRRLLEEKVHEQVEQVVPQTVEDALAGVLVPQTVTILNRQTTVVLAPSAISFDDQAPPVQPDANFLVPSLPGTTPPTAPGSLVASAPGLPTLDLNADLQASLNVDILNRIAFAAWQGDLTRYTFDDAALQSFNLPVPITLDGFFLQTMVPSLAGQISPNDPVEIEVSLGTAPVFQTLAYPDILRASFGDLTLSVYVTPLGQARTLVAKIALQVQADVQMAIVNHSIQLNFPRTPTLLVDLVEAPFGRFDVVELQNLIDQILPVALGFQTQVLQAMPLPVIQGLTPSALTLEQDPNSTHYLNLKGDF